ncbi:DUF2975 domain-containing protein [Halalkalibacillus halophilus]|uniref:DUF2975 domain-containing protein n=1 Tax=Halalkalibacillus halophilus TaxID=392827 RepID=UPI000414075B|nr:DUF2975 domain-containing protein [Halalkalibacillus halophilus]
MQKGTIWFLRMVAVLLGLGVLALCAIVLPMLMIDLLDSRSFVQVVMYSIIVGMYLAAIPFYIALFKVMKLLRYIDRGDAFTNRTVQSLKGIKWCGLWITFIYILMMPFIFIFGERDDAPGVIAIGMAVIFGSFVIAVFASLLQKLLISAIDIKAENELTI